MFAASKSATARRATQQVFTSTGTWVAPSTVSNVSALTGIGGTGRPAEWISGNQSIYGIYRGDGPDLLGTLSWDSFYSSAVSTIAALNSGGPGERLAPDGVPLEFYFVNPDDTAFPGSDFTGYLDGYLIRNTASLLSTNARTSGPILYSQLNSGFSGWSIGGSLQVFEPTVTGGTTTALGYSFPGGEGGPATPITYFNVPVTPGASYFIYPAPGGSVSLTYLV
jgi:hypothetical protein